MKIDISNQNPYEAVIETIRKLTTKNGYEDVCDRVVRIRTTVLGESNEVLYVEDGYYDWDSDWYEGGEVELLGFISIEDVNVPLLDEPKTNKKLCDDLTVEAFDEDKMDMLEIAVQKNLERFHSIPERTGADDLLIDIYATMFEYMKELRKQIET